MEVPYIGKAFLIFIYTKSVSYYLLSPPYEMYTSKMN